MEVRTGLSRYFVQLYYTTLHYVQLTKNCFLHSSRSLRPQLHTMPTRNFLLEHLIHKLMLLYDRQARELARLNLNGVHGAAPAADVLDL